MDCEALLAYLSAYLDNELDGPLVAAAQAHLATCQNCRVVLDSTKQVIMLYRALEQVVIPAGRRQRLFDELQAAFQGTGTG
ncbi:MAG: zf-HC2 domain-containing protein [Anaerolineales bacterium]|nr:zf-HC2 domain-containing protein [Anaerolineales bacterium]